MGVVHAKDTSNNDPSEVSFIGIKAKIQKVNVDGLRRTKDDVVINSVKDVFSANDFESAIRHIHEARIKLQNLGCFKNVEVLIDTYDGINARDDGIEVTFEVKESNLFGANIQTNVGNNEGSVSTGGALRNVFGRGEEMTSTYSYGTNKKSCVHAMAKIPTHNKYKANYTAELFQDWLESSRSSYKQVDRGAIFGLHFFSLHNVNHKITFDNTWRHLSCLSPSQTPFSVREEAGHSLKASIIHEVKVDTRDQAIFPKDGICAKLKNELAGGLIGGNIAFAKNELEIEVNLPLFQNLAIQGNVQAGHLFNIRNNHGHKICDRFFLGGPSSIRGFEIAGIGPHDHGYALGGEMYWAAGLHFFTPMPFLPTGGFSDKFRLQGFVNMGNNDNFKLDSNYKAALQKQISDMRLAYGVGIAMNLVGMARLELNYCIPLLHQRGDRPVQGLQFGLATNFL